MTELEGERTNPVPIVYQSLKAGLSARAGLRAARDQGVKIRDATWFQMYSEARALQVAAIDEFAAPLERRPMGREIKDWSTKAATGHIQYVEVYVRDIDTGVVGTRPFALRLDKLIPRGEAIQRALTRFSVEAHPEGNYPRESVIGAAYSGTFRLVPRDE